LLATINSLVLDDGIPMVSSLKLAVLACAGALIGYSVSVYYYRLSLLQQGKPFGYTDRVGPAFLAIAVLFGGTIILIKTYGRFAAKPVSVLKEGPGCFRYIHGIAPLEYKPSAVVVQREMLLVPSFSQVTAVSRNKPVLARYRHLQESSNTTAQSLLTIPGTDIKSIALAEDRIFVVAEGKNQSTLIELAWVDNNGTDVNSLESVGSWGLDPALAVQGLAHVPQENGDRLYFGDKEGVIYSTLVPAKSSGKAQLELKQLNQNFFRRGLDDPKIASLQYLDGILYVLHDNAGIVRGWDTVLGVLHSEWHIPVPPGAANQTEGFYLEKSSQGKNLRGDSRQSYLMHLAVDSPAQLWTLMVDINTADDHSSITYPACAGDAIPVSTIY
jgi:hypothetical protein